MANEITDLTALASADNADELIVYDVSEASGNSKKITRGNLLTDVAFEGGDHDFGTSQITDLTTTDSTLGFSGGATLTKIRKGSLSVTPPNINTLTSDTQTATISGAVVTDHVAWSINGPLPDGLTLQVWVSAADTISFKFYNTTAGTITGATYTALVTVLTYA